ncbi:MAG: acetyl-CoA hydrolase/transferase family protein [Chitinophagales bacterium]
MDYKSIYRSKVCSVEEALSQIKSHDSITCSLIACEPVTLLSHLHTIKDRVEDVTVCNAFCLGDYEFFNRRDMKGHFILYSWFYTDSLRKSHPYGTVSYAPFQLHTFGRTYLETRRPRVFMGCASPMDRHGYLSLSLDTVCEKESMEVADVVIIEVNDRLPRTFGDTNIHISQIDHVVETSHELPQFPQFPVTEHSAMIGAYVAELIEDGSTIQIGIGEIPRAVTLNLMDHKDLGVHTELFTDCMLDLCKAGVITNRKKSIWKDKMVGDCAIGGRELYDFLGENLAVEFQPGRIVNDPAVIRQNNKMVSINAALEVDLTGQVCAESIGIRHFSGTGGHKEFTVGASQSPGGKSIIALSSTAKGDTISRIVPAFGPGTAVTASRIDVDYVVTEHGAACLRGRSIKERVTELINVAHPDFRDFLRSEANRNMIW